MKIHVIFDLCVCVCMHVYGKIDFISSHWIGLRGILLNVSGTQMFIAGSEGRGQYGREIKLQFIIFANGRTV